MVIRGFSTDEIRSIGAVKVILREALAGALLGLMLGVVATVWAFWLQNDLQVAMTVGLSLFAISILSTVAGSGLPFLFRFLGRDPALMSAPFITTIVDVLGVLIYFYIAGLLLGLA